MTDQTQSISSVAPAAKARAKAPFSLSRLPDAMTGWLLSLPLALVLFFFLVLPIAMIVVVSFWGRRNSRSIRPSSSTTTNSC